MKKKIYIADTGGTIGMKPGDRGYEPSPGYLKEQMAKMAVLKSPSMPEYHIHEYDPPLDSSSMSPSAWFDIAEDIAAHHAEYDGFLVIHGTDTMAYTASALPFMLEGLQKPVILTGGQIPLCEVRNDSRENLITAMLLAAREDIHEVCLFFDNRLFRGNRTTKWNAGGFDAFDSPNFPPLGTTGIDIEINRDLLLPKPEGQGALRVQRLYSSPVAVLRLFPGISAAVVKNLLAPPIKGLVLETYGVGNAPDNDPELMAVLKEATDRGVVVVNCTQCLKGRVMMGTYATGSALLEAGVISGFDMTPEAALAKMFFLFSTRSDAGEIRELMQASLKGEMTA
ncbi:asparaginase [Desulfoluna butyratoxydans]|uniref:asparaginase n=1 Tax=Desulfoluna butyratoxydans TaxID=231438 RepID=A0A4U8YZT6_9BACT|nr:asparaginase [Desulfoluna butyratoxydans]VFQ47483.1 l-asparaginase type i [Desulfoluna butyratoxydans]